MRDFDRRSSTGIALPYQAPPSVAILTVVVLLAPLYLHGLGAVDIIGDDEAREVGIIQDIAERDRWILPRFNDTSFPDKPLLYHWLAAGSCLVTGRCNEHAVRVPSAVAALALIAVVGLAAARFFDAPTGIAAALLVGLSPFLFEHARVARPDILTTLALTAALFTFYGWWQDGCRSRPRAALTGTLLGIAVLAKGPVAPAVGTVTILAFLALRRQLGQGRALLAAHVLVPFLAIGGTWYAAALAAWGQPFAREHLLGRYLGNVLGGHLAVGVEPSHSLLHHVSFYPLHLLLGTLPWTPLLIAAAIAIWRDPQRRGDPRLQFLQVWIATVVVLFSFAAFKLRHYLLPAIPAAAMLAAPLFATLVQGPTGTPRPFDALRPERNKSRRRAILLSLAGSALVVSATAFWWWAGGPAQLSRSDRELAHAIETAARTHFTAAAIGGATGVLLCSAGLYVILRGNWRQLIGLGIAGTLAWMLVIQPSIQSALAGRASLKPFAAAVTDNVPEGAPLYFFGQILRPVVVYVGRPIPRLRQHGARTAPGPTYIIVTEASLPRLLETGRHVRTIAEHVGRVGNLARGRVLLVEISSSE